jgi:hypothetical protein
MKFFEFPATVQWFLVLVGIALVFLGMCWLGQTQYGRFLMIGSVGALSMFHKIHYRSWSSSDGPTRYSRF